jgi:replicative superfamily II helicase
VQVRELLEQGAPAPLVDVWARTMTSLTPIQERAVRAGALDGVANLLVVAPTTSGKTFVGEMAAASMAYRTRRPALFLVPFRALADEHYELFRDRYVGLLSVVISTSDWNEFDGDIRAGNFGLGVMTYEKLTGLLVSRPQLLATTAVIVVDEMQMLADRDRGPALEVMLTQVCVAAARPQVIALSASLDSLNRLDEWLGATAVVENDRPVPLHEGVLSPDTGSLARTSPSGFEESAFQSPAADRDAAIASACRTFVGEGKQVLVFRTSARKVPDTAHLIARELPAPGLAPATAALLDTVERSDTLEAQRRLLASGVGFHTADLPSAERRAVERSFRTGDTRVIVSSGTLAMGVNLPTDVVIVGDTLRWVPDRWNWRRESISVADYKNQVGRAGRLGQRAEGLGVLVAENRHEQRQMLDLYCNGEVEPVESKLPGQPFDDVVFKVLALDIANSPQEITEFLCSTFAYLTFWERQGGLREIEDGVARSVDVCLRSQLVREEDGELRITPDGRIFARHGIPLDTAARLSELADDLRQTRLPDVEVVYRLALSDQLFARRPFTKWNRLTHRLDDPRGTISFDLTSVQPEHSLHTALSREPRDDIEARVLLRTGCLIDWSAGVSETELGRRYDGCGAARLVSMGSETGARTLLLLPIDALAEGVIRCQEGEITADEIADVLVACAGGARQHLVQPNRRQRAHPPRLARGDVMRRRRSLPTKRPGAGSAAYAGSASTDCSSSAAANSSVSSTSMSATTTSRGRTGHSTYKRPNRARSHRRDPDPRITDSDPTPRPARRTHPRIRSRRSMRPS